MNAQKFVHLHTHSHYSLLEAIPKISDLLAAAKADGQEALALTDNGNLYGAIEFYKEAKATGIKPIIGVDFYVAPRSRHDKDRIDERTARLVLIAKDDTGYRNLIKLVSRGHLEGFYYKPRIDRELIEEHKDGLLAIVPSFEGEHVRALTDNNHDAASQTLAWYRSIFGKDVYAEITHHPEIDGHEKLQEKIIALATEAGVPLVAAHDTYYLQKDDAAARELVIKIKNGGVLNREAEDVTTDFSFIAQEKAATLFAKTPEALENTLAIAAACNLELDLGKWVFPNFPIPAGKTHDEVLREKAYAGFATRNLPQSASLTERVDYELSVIQKKGYAPYFLVVADLLRFAHEHRILTNIRGSVAGSLVTYLSHITNVNPIEYGLPFERFLNPERPSAPDIDMDYADNRRDEVIAYARQKYGEENVAQIGTFGTMMARAAVRDVSRALGHSYGTGDRIAKMIPFGKQGFPVTIENSLESVPDLAKAYKSDPEAREILDMALRIEGNARHVGVHAAGVVIAPSKVTEFTPIQLDPKGGKTITQYDMHAVEDAGLLKFDFLGLTNLSTLADARDRVKTRLDIEIDFEKIPLDDKKTFEMLSRGETLGVFQLAGGGMTSYLVDLKPSVIHDINAMVALYRPGPMNFIPQYIERKHDPRKVTYLDPRLEPILKNSYGVITYQDDVLQIAIQFAGYSWLEADKFRKAMGKKIPAEMAAQKEKFVKGCLEHGKMKPDIVEQLWQQIETFAAYGFNKCLTADTRIYNADTGEPSLLGEQFARKSAMNVYAMSEDQTILSAKASEPFENGVKQVYRLRTRSGRVIRATDNHPFKTFDGWTPLGKLQPGTRIAAPRRLPEPGKAKPMRTHEAATLGYLLSEGNLCHPHGIYFYSTQDDEIKDFISTATQFFNAKITIDRSKPAASVYVGQVDQKKGSTLRKWIFDLGLIGKKATEKFVPDAVFQTNNESLAIFLGKLWQGDGCASVKNQYFYYATSSRRLADDVQHLLLRFGIVSTVHTKQFKYRESYKTGWTVTIHGEHNFNAFMSTIGQHLIGVKKETAESVCANSRIRTNNRGRGTVDTLPAEIFEVLHEAIGSFHGTIKTLAQTAGISQRVLYQDTRKRGYTRRTLTALADALHSAQLKMHVSSDIFWDEVVSIEPDGEEMTYDLTVPGPSNFIANGLIVHNSHAASYGRLAYETAYMKANYPVDYMAAVLTSDAGDVEKIAEVVHECKRMRIHILPPSVNESRGTFTVIDDQTIRFGLYSVKNFGTGIADAIIAEREAVGPYTSISNFLTRVADKNLNKKSLEALIMSGSLDQLGERNSLLTHIEKLLEYRRELQQAPAGLSSLFGAATSTAADLKIPEEKPATMEQKLVWEKELLGFYVSGHPLDRCKPILDRQKLTLKDAKEKFPKGVETVIAGLLEAPEFKLTKNGERMMFGRLADYVGAVEIIVFPRTLTEYSTVLHDGACVALKGKFSERNGESSFVAEKVKAL